MSAKIILRIGRKPGCNHVKSNLEIKVQWQLAEMHSRATYHLCATPPQLRHACSWTDSLVITLGVGPDLKSHDIHTLPP